MSPGALLALSLNLSEYVLMVHALDQTQQFSGVCRALLSFIRFNTVTRLFVVWLCAAVHSTGTREKNFVGHEARINKLATSVDGQLLATGDIDGVVKLWNTSGEGLSVLQQRDPESSLFHVTAIAIYICVDRLHWSNAGNMSLLGSGRGSLYQPSSHLFLLRSQLACRCLTYICWNTSSNEW